MVWRCAGKMHHLILIIFILSIIQEKKLKAADRSCILRGLDIVIFLISDCCPEISTLLFCFLFCFFISFPFSCCLTVIDKYSYLSITCSVINYILDIFESMHTFVWISFLILAWLELKLECYRKIKLFFFNRLQSFQSR